MAEVSNDRGAARLNSWKEIAAFFGKDERTVKRWEVSRGLPVRRVPGGRRTSVFAYVNELEEWLTSRPAGRGATPAEKASASPAPPASVLPSSRPFALWLGVLAGAGLLLALFFGPSLTTLLPTAATQGAHVPPAEARELYLSGVYDWNTRTPAGLRRAIQTFEAAIAIDPGYAAAYAGLANAYNLLSQYSLAPAAEAYPKAKAAAEKALALDPELAEGYAALAFSEFYGFRQYARSAELFERALALDPGSAQVHHWYALTAMHMGDFAKPIEHISRAAELAPDSRSIRANKALILFHAGRVEEALAILTGMQTAYPDFLATPSYLATIYLAQARYGDFLREYEKAATLEQNPARLAIASAARAGLAQGGGTGMLSAMLAEQERQFALGAEPAYKLAGTAALLG
ncbi:MAG TPA: hypothetical protein GYA10_00920, partial [Alphaproteobacteria bacterium]|nr:hypothetical protein [Alphaproteobacteria bacterium]